jgi:hypothetical protein
MTITNGIILTPVSAEGIPITESASNPNTDWETIKVFWQLTTGAQVNFIEGSDHYYIWCVYKGRTFSIPHLLKSSAEGLEFEAQYKSKYHKH